MMITIHRARVYNPSTGKVAEFHSQYRGKVESRLAAACVVAWGDNSWPDGGPPPEIPKDVGEIISAYFWGGGESEYLPWVEWGEIQVDLAPMLDAPLDLSGCGYRLSVERAPCEIPGSTFTLVKGDLLRDEGMELSGEMEAAADAIESFVLSLASHGFPVHLPEFVDALKTTLEAVANNIE